MMLLNILGALFVHLQDGDDNSTLQDYRNEVVYVKYLEQY